MALRPWEGGTSIWFARCSSASMALPTVGLHYAPASQWRGSLQLINGSCLSRVPSFSPPRLYWRVGTHIQHPRRWRHPVPTRPCAAPACSPERSNYTSRHPPWPVFDVSTQDDARSAKNLSYLFLARVCWPYTPVPRHTCTSDAPGRQACPAIVSVAYMCCQQGPLTVCLPCPYVRAAFRACKCRRRKVWSRGRHLLTVHPRVGVGEEGSTEIYFCAPRPEGFPPEDALPFRPTSPRLVLSRPSCMPLPLRAG